MEDDEIDNASGDVRTFSGDWWWIASHILLTPLPIEYAAPDSRWEQHPIPNGVTIELYLADYRMLALTITGEDGQTTIDVIDNTDPARWEQILDTLYPLTLMARRLRRQAIGAQLQDVIEDYYQRKERGERMKLKDLAEAAGVNYHSLRQAKYRYDEKNREMSTLGDKNKPV